MINHVWVVETGAYSDRFINGIYDSLEAAKKSTLDVRITCNREYSRHVHGWQERKNEKGEITSLDNWCAVVEITKYELHHEI